MADIASQLKQLEFNWQLNGNALVLEIQTADFNEAVWVVAETAKAANELNHHPNVSISGYNRLYIELSTHDSGSVTKKDLALAEKIDAIIARTKH
jgi:4a-hydroxytetrahydrobiopterin dehydratase